MPLTKRGTMNGSMATITTPPAETQKTAETESKPANPEKYTSHRGRTEMTKDDYWRRREERDVQRDKDMAWSGIAQAILESPYAGQYNLESTLDGYLEFVAQATNKLLAKRPK